MVPGRAFLRRLINLICKISNPFHSISLNREAQTDIKMWKIFVDNFNGKSMFLSQSWVTSEDMTLFTDAAGSIGFAGVLGNKWFAL